MTPVTNYNPRIRQGEGSRDSAALSVSGQDNLSIIQGVQYNKGGRVQYKGCSIIRGVEYKTRGTVQ